MMWERMTIYPDPDDSPADEMPAIFAEIAAQGWEPFAVIPLPHANYGCGYALVCKRKVPQ